MRAFAVCILPVFLLTGYGAATAENVSDFAPRPYVEIEHPPWTRDAVIYQLNTRQFTPEGTFAAAAAHLPRLAEMGVDIIWLMPIHPIGEARRKGELGSPYAVRDYRAVNPDLGGEEAFRAFVAAAHRAGMRVILDWVANHSAWDSPLTENHPDWYSKTPEGDLTTTPGTDWFDTADFDYAQADLRAYMTESLVYWVREFDVDGYRADVAGFAPLDFWETARRKLDAVKPVFMLAEWESRDLHRRAFDATYAWSWKDAMKSTAEAGGASAMRNYYATDRNVWPRGAFRMVYTDNHDQNAWDGVAAEIYGDAYEAAIALSFVGAGIPLIYNGQEADLSHQLSFFDKDEIPWREGRHGDLFARLAALKHSTRALWNGEYGATMVEAPNSAEDSILSFVRESDRDRVFTVFNLTAEDVSFEMMEKRHAGLYTDVFSGETVLFEGADALALAPWGYRVFRADKDAP